jgi:hypothetical protein
VDIVNEPKSIPESNRIGSVAADLAAPAIGKYEFPTLPAFRCYMADASGVEAIE